MSALKAYTAQELTRIEACLREKAQALSPYVRPTALHVLEAGGKRLRPMLTILTARALGYGSMDIYPLACSLELLHSATLLHDDILDRGDMRRGRPTAHTIFGRTHTILAGDVLLALANTTVASYDRPALTACLSEAILATASGEIEEIAHIRDADLTLEGYLSIITGKTACLIQAACQSGAILAGASPEMERTAADFGRYLGIAFQLVDDVLDYTSTKEVAGKTTGGDLREGKLTLPLIFYIESLAPEAKERFTSAFKHNTLHEEDVELVLQQVAKDGHAKRSRDIAGSYLQQARECLARFPEVPETAFLAAALEGMASRDK